LAGNVHIDFSHVLRYLAKALTGDFSITSQEELILFQCACRELFLPELSVPPFRWAELFSSDSAQSVG